jgi:hypothetical protein
MKAKQLEGGINPTEVVDQLKAAQPPNDPPHKVRQPALGGKRNAVGGKSVNQVARCNVVFSIARHPRHTVCHALYRLILNHHHSERPARHDNRPTISAGYMPALAAKTGGNEQSSWPCAVVGARYQRLHKPTA